MIPDSVSRIGNFSFAWCSNLSDITIPSSVESIGISSFQQCGHLISITIPDSVRSIGDNAFQQCGLESIRIPDSVTGIAERTFSGVRKHTVFCVLCFRSRLCFVCFRCASHRNTPKTHGPPWCLERHEAAGHSDDMYYDVDEGVLDDGDA